MFGSYNQPGATEMMQPRRTTKFGSVAEAIDFVKIACTSFVNFPQGFESEVKHRLEHGDKRKAGLANRLGAWFRAFRSLTEGAYPELRAAFARSVALNFDGHDSKNAWIYELAPARYLSLTDAAAKLGVKTSRLRMMLMHMPSAAPVKENTFNTMTQAQCDELKQHVDSALNFSQVIDITGLTESVLRQLIRVGLLPKRERQALDLNLYKPFDQVDVQAMQCALFGHIKADERADLQTVSINDLNKRMATNKAVVDELFEQLAQGSLKAVNANIPTKLGGLLFDREQVTLIVGNSHDVAMLTAEQLSRMTGWKSESIRHCVKSGLLVGEEGQLRGRPVYWVSMHAVHQFMCDYKTVSELAGLLGTSPKAVSERLKALGVPILGAMQVAPGVVRGGLVALKDVLFSGLSPKQAQLFDEKQASYVASFGPVTESS